PLVPVAAAECNIQSTQRNVFVRAKSRYSLFDQASRDSKIPFAISTLHNGPVEGFEDAVPHDMRAGIEGVQQLLVLGNLAEIDNFQFNIRAIRKVGTCPGKEIRGVAQFSLLKQQP